LFTLNGEPNCVMPAMSSEKPIGEVAPPPMVRLAVTGMAVVSAPFESKSSTSGLPAPAPRSTLATGVSSTEAYMFH
jgi:hypothetical protein